MTQQRDRNLAASIQARLLNQARERREDFNFNLQRYVAERFLYRLGASAHGRRFILKGAMLFPLWGGSPHRPTRDLDLGGFTENDPGVLREALQAIFVYHAPPMPWSSGRTPSGWNPSGTRANTTGSG